MQDCGNSSALALELLQSCTKPSIFSCLDKWNPEQNGSHLANIFKCIISLIKIYIIQNSQKFIPTDIKSTVVQLMDLHWINSLHEPILIQFQDATHGITRPQWVKTSTLIMLIMFEYWSRIMMSWDELTRIRSHHNHYNTVSYDIDDMRNRSDQEFISDIPISPSWPCYVYAVSVVSILKNNAFVIREPKAPNVPRALIRCHLSSVGNPIVEMRWSKDHLISTMWVPIPVRQYLYINSSPLVMHICVSKMGQHWFR